MDHYYNNVFKRSHESISGGNLLDNEVDQKLRKLALDLARERQASSVLMGNDLQMHGMTKPSTTQVHGPEYQRMMNNPNNGFAVVSNGSVSSMQVPSMVDMQKTFLMMMQQQQLQQAQHVADTHVTGSAVYNVAGNVKSAISSGNVFQERGGISTHYADRGDCAVGSASTNLQRQHITRENSTSSPADQTRSNSVDEKLLETQTKILKQQEMFFERVVELVSMTTTLVHGVLMKYGLTPMEQPIPDQQQNMQIPPFVANNSAKTAGAAKGFYHNLGQPASISSSKVPVNPAFCSLPNAGIYFPGGMPLPTSSGFNASYNDALNSRRVRPSGVVGHPVRRNFASSFNDCTSVPVESTVIGSLVTPSVSKSQMNIDNTVKAVSLSPNATSSPSISSPGLETLASTASEIVPPVFVMISPNSIKKE